MLNRMLYNYRFAKSSIGNDELNEKKKNFKNSDKIIFY